VINRAPTYVDGAFGDDALLWLFSSDELADSRNASGGVPQRESPR